MMVYAEHDVSSCLILNHAASDSDLARLAYVRLDELSLITTCNNLFILIQEYAVSVNCQCTQDGVQWYAQCYIA